MSSSRGSQHQRAATPRAPFLALSVLLNHAVMVLLCVLTVFPIVWMFGTAFEDPAEIFSGGLHLGPEKFTLSNFATAFDLFPVARWLGNSVIISVTITLGKLLIAVPAAYAFARLRFKGRDVLFGCVLGTMMVPYVITIIPNYVTVAELGWINTVQGVILPSLAFTSLSVFLIRQTMLSMPAELFDAARVDGAGSFRLMWSMAIPLARPTITAVGVLAFLSSWNLYLWPLLILGDLPDKTLPVGLQYFSSEQSFDAQHWGGLMAATVVSVLPPLLLYIAAQRRIVDAFVHTTLRGSH